MINRDGEPTKLLKYTSDTDEATKINKDVHDKREFVASGDTFTVRFCLTFILLLNKLNYK